MKVFKDFKEDMDKSLSEEHETRICESQRMKTIKNIKWNLTKNLLKYF